jgi:hypothetical protein
MATRLEILSWRIACAAVVILYVLLTPLSWQCEGVDDIEYLGLAHSLVRGEGYTLYGEPYVYYPPLYPAALSVVMKGAGVGAWRPLYAVTALFGALGLVVLASHVRRHGGEAGRWAAWFSLVSYYPWSFSTRYLMADPLCFLLSAIGLASAGLLLRPAAGRRARGLLMVPAAFLASTTKAAALALTAALTGACALSGVLSRKAAPLFMASVVASAAGGFSVAWELRAQRVDPHAKESYGRWLKKFLGASPEETGWIAQSVGEGIDRRTSLPERFVLCGLKTGQSVLSLVRPPRNAEPLFGLLWLLVLAGLWRMGREDPASPLVWYTGISLVMICLTSWVSSYTRYLYVLTPLLFLCLLRGGEAAAFALRGAVRRPVAITMAAGGLAGIVWTAVRGLGAGQSPAETLYMKGMGLAVFGVYLVLAIAGGVTAVRGQIPRLPRTPSWVLAAAVALLAIHNTALVAQRHRLTLNDATPEQLRLIGPKACGRWLAEHAEPGSRCITTFPRMAAFLADRDMSGPLYEGARLRLEGADYVMTLGEVRGIPAFSATDERNLERAVLQEVDGGRLRKVFSDEGAAVYTVVVSKS